MGRNAPTRIAVGLLCLAVTGTRGTPCTSPISGPCCGDGIVQGDGIGTTGEQCDSGNLNQAGSGCTKGCITEKSFYCSGSPSVCRLTSKFKESGSGSVTQTSGQATQASFQSLFSTAVAAVPGMIGPKFTTNPPNGQESTFSLQVDQPTDAAKIPDLTTRLNALAASRGMTIKYNHNCGNGEVELGEWCDDGGRDHGCKSDCTPDDNNKCYGNLVTEQLTNPLRTIQRQVCTFCGNGNRDQNEQCDDGNTIENDGCSSRCLVQGGWSCTGFPSVCTLGGGGPLTPSTPGTACGNGRREGTEYCDDGNTLSGDGCSVACLVESGWVCTGGFDVLSHCTRPNATAPSPAPLASPTSAGTDDDDDDDGDSSSPLWLILLIALILLSCLLLSLVFWKCNSHKGNRTPVYIEEPLPSPPPAMVGGVPFIVHEPPPTPPEFVYDYEDDYNNQYNYY